MHVALPRGVAPAYDARMVEREERGDGSFRLWNARGSVLWILHNSRVLELKLDGHAEQEVLGPIMAEVAALLDRTSGVYVFSDLEELEGYEADLWKNALTWVGQHRSRMAGLFALQTSQAVEMGTRLLNLFSANALIAFTHRPEYLKKLRECLKLAP